MPGTCILTDSLAAYNQLEVVNHQLHFMDPSDWILYTNTIEGSWGDVKAKFWMMHGTSDTLFNSHLQEFFKTTSSKTSIFGHVTTTLCSLSHTPENIKTVLFRATTFIIITAFLELVVPFSTGQTTVHYTWLSLSTCSWV